MLKKLKLNNMSLGIKLVIPLIVPMVALILISIMSVFYVQGLSNQLVTNLYNEVHQSDYFLLNADRDYYQALTAEMQMQSAKSQDEISKAKSDYIENIGQTVQRVHKAKSIILSDYKIFEKYTHKTSRLSLKELFDKFDENYNEWHGLFDADNNTLADKDKYNATFDSTRECINQIEEILDVCGNDIILKSNKSVGSTKSVIIIVTIIAGIIALALGIIIIHNVRERTKKVLKLINKTANFDLVYDTSYNALLEEHDEFAYITKAESNARKEFRNLITSVVKQTEHLNNVVDSTNAGMAYLVENIENISSTTEQLSGGMEETAASTQEMSASSHEIERATESIAQKAELGAMSVGSIRTKANQLEVDFKNSVDNGNKILDSVKVKLQKSLEESKAVEQINTLADAILDITSQTNLLALNASIEAARAGEAGKGFAVVADEIGKLADDSKQTVAKIQEIAQNVVNSVDNLASNSNELLNYVANEVSKDYNMMLTSTNKYGNDMNEVNDMVTNFSATSEELLASIQNMMRAIGEVTEAANEGAYGTTNIAEKAVEIVEKSKEVSHSINSAKEGSDALKDLVSKFKI